MADRTQLLNRFAGRPGADERVISFAETFLGWRFPREYVTFLTQRNGGEGFVGENYLLLYAVEDLATVNMGYDVNESVPGLLLIGSNGAGEAFGFDVREDEWRVVMVPFVGMSWRDAVWVGASLDEFLLRLSEDKLF